MWVGEVEVVVAEVVLDLLLVLVLEVWEVVLVVDGAVWLVVLVTALLWVVLAVVAIVVGVLLANADENSARSEASADLMEEASEFSAAVSIVVSG